MLWVEQPVGTGFSQGKVHAHSEIGVAKDFVGFFKNWEKLFGIENYKIYITVSNTLQSALPGWTSRLECVFLNRRGNLHVIPAGRVLCRAICAVYLRWDA